ncbi:MAG: VTT domain-containing protein [Candidatus Paceibacterota bacterium]
MKEKFIKWSENVANHKHALKSLFWVSFAESCISPFPAYFLVLFILAHKVKYSWKKVAWIATLGSILGGVLGYFIGFYLFKLVGQPIVNFYSLQDEFNKFGDKLLNNQFWILLVAAMTPIPFKVTAIASGVFAVNFPLFILTSILGRGIKFIGVSFFTHKYGVKVKDSLTDSFWTSVITFIIICLVVYFLLF